MIKTRKYNVKNKEKNKIKWCRERAIISIDNQSMFIFNSIWKKSYNSVWYNYLKTLNTFTQILNRYIMKDVEDKK